MLFPPSDNIKHPFHLKSKKRSQKDAFSYIYNFFFKCMEKFPCLQMSIPRLFTASMEKWRYSLNGCTPSSVLPFPNVSSLQDISIHTAALLLLLFCLFDLWWTVFPGCCGYSRLSGLETGSDFLIQNLIKGSSGTFVFVREKHYVVLAKKWKIFVREK